MSGSSFGAASQLSRSGESPHSHSHSHHSIPPAPPLPPKSGAAAAANAIARFASPFLPLQKSASTLTQGLSATQGSSLTQGSSPRKDEETSPVKVEEPGPKIQGRSALRKRDGPSRRLVHRAGIPISALDISPDREYAVLAGRDILKTIRVDDMSCSEEQDVRGSATFNAGGLLSAQQRDNLAAEDVKWSNGIHATKIATSSLSGRVTIYDLEHPDYDIQVLHEHTRQVHKLSFQPSNGSLLLSGSQDGSIKLWDLRAPSNRATTFHGYSESVRNLQWNPVDPHLFASCSENGVLVFWDARRSNSPNIKVNAHDATCHGLDWHPNGKLIITGGADRLVKTWNGRSSDRRMKPLHVLRCPHAVASCKWRPLEPGNESDFRAATFVATSYDEHDPRIQVWDLKRPYIAWREWSSYENSLPRQILWRDDEVVWSVADETFKQNDLHDARRPMDSVSFTPFAVAPQGDIVVFQSDYDPKVSPVLEYEGQGYFDPKFPPSRDEDEGSPVGMFRPDLEEHNSAPDLTQPLPPSSLPKQKSRRKSTSWATNTRKATPEFSTPDPEAFLNVNLDPYPPIKQTSLIMHNPFSNDHEVLPHLAREMHLPSRIRDGVDYARRIQRSFNRNAEIASKLGRPNIAQTWRVLGQAVASELRLRRKLAVQARKTASASTTNKKEKDKGDPVKKKLEPSLKGSPEIASLGSPLQEARRGLLSMLEPSGSNQATPKVKPAPLVTGDVPEQSLGEALRPLSAVKTSPRIGTGDPQRSEAVPPPPLKVASPSLPAQSTFVEDVTSPVRPTYNVRAISAIKIGSVLQGQSAVQIPVQTQVQAADDDESQDQDGKSDTRDKGNNEFLLKPRDERAQEQTESPEAHFRELQSRIAARRAASINYRAPIKTPFRLEQPRDETVRDYSRRESEDSSFENTLFASSVPSSVARSIGSGAASPFHARSFEHMGSLERREFERRLELEARGERDEIEEEDEEEMELPYRLPGEIQRVESGDESPKGTTVQQPEQDVPKAYFVRPENFVPRPPLYQWTPPPPRPKKVKKGFFWRDYLHELPPDQENVPWHASSLLPSVLDYHTKIEPDSQTPALLALHLYEFYPAIFDHNTCKAYLSQYHLDLTLFQLYISATSLRKMLEGTPFANIDGTPPIQSMNLWCEKCQKVKKGHQTHCLRCGTPHQLCPICESLGPALGGTLDGLKTIKRKAKKKKSTRWILCQTCGHGGHETCYDEWLGGLNAPPPKKKPGLPLSFFDAPTPSSADVALEMIRSKGQCLVENCGCDCLPGLVRQKKRAERNRRDVFPRKSVQSLSTRHVQGKAEKTDKMDNLEKMEPRSPRGKRQSRASPLSIGLRGRGKRGSL